QLHGTSALLAMLPALALTVCCAWQLLPAGTLRLARGLPSVIALRGIAAAAFFGFERSCRCCCRASAACRRCWPAWR
ncbi:MFS transporter, partial [Xanthomonas arboricola pv. pruni str. MAFF 311562]